MEITFFTAYLHFFTFHVFKIVPRMIYKSFELRSLGNNESPRTPTYLLSLIK